MTYLFPILHLNIKNSLSTNILKYSYVIKNTAFIN